jgi:ligand-binding sensor domain-containing protein
MLLVAGHNGAGAGGIQAEEVSPARPASVISGEWRSIANGEDVRSLAREGDLLWAGTLGGGIVQWDLRTGQYRQFIGPQDGLPCNDVRDIIRFEGAWWFGTCRGLAIYDEQARRIIPVAAFLPSDDVTALAIDGRGRLWVGTAQVWGPTVTPEGGKPGAWVGGGLAVRQSATEWIHYGVKDGLPSANVADVVEYRGRMWVGSAPYMAWSPPAPGPGGTEPGRWSSQGGGLGRLLDAGWQTLDVRRNLNLSENVRSLVTDGTYLWVATGGKGILVHDGSETDAPVWAVLDACSRPGACPPDNYITALALDPLGAVWAGLERFNHRGIGVGLLDHGGTPMNPDDDAWVTYTNGDGLAGELVHAILPEADGSVWFGSTALLPGYADDYVEHGKGLSRLLTDRRSFEGWSTVDRGLGGLPGNYVTAVAFHPSGEVWVGTAHRGVGVLRANGEWTHHTRQNTAGGLASDDIADIAVHPDGSVWVATRRMTYDARQQRWTDGGLSRYRDGQWRALTTANSRLPDDHLSSLAIDEQGRIWIGMGAADQGPKELSFRGKGIALYHPNADRWEGTWQFPAITSNNVLDIVASGDEVWAASSYFWFLAQGREFLTGGGADRFVAQGNRWQHYQDVLPITARTSGDDPLWDERSIAVTPGTTWVGSWTYPAGARLAPRAEWVSVLSSIRSSGVNSLHFARAGIVRSLAVDSLGNVWVATSQDGARVITDEVVLYQTTANSGIGSDRLVTVATRGEEAWLGTERNGLSALQDPEYTPLSEHIYLAKVGAGY